MAILIERPSRSGFQGTSESAPACHGRARPFERLVGWLVGCRRRVHGSRFGRNFLAVARANLVAQVLPIAVAPLLTRLYLPEHFGVAAIFASLIGILVSFCTLRFDWSIPNARTSDEAAGLFVLGAAALVTTTGLVAGMIQFGIGLPGPWAGYAPLGGLAMLIPPAMFATGVHALFQGWFVRQGSLRAVGRTQIGQSAAQAGLGIAGGLSGLGAGGLVGASVLSSWVGIGTMLHEARELPGRVRGLTVRRVWRTARIFGSESACSTAVSIFNVVGSVASVVLLSQYYTANEVGWYALAVRLLYAPVAAIVKALGQSFWSRASEFARDGRPDELRRLYLETTGILGVACVPVVVVCLAGPLVVGPIFGEERWSGAGPVMLALTPMLVGTILFSPTSHLVVFGMQGVQAIADGARLALVCCSVVAGHAFGFSFPSVVLAASSSSLIGYLGLFAVHLAVHARIKNRLKRRVLGCPIDEHASLGR